MGRTGADDAVSRDLAEAVIGKCLETVNQLTNGSLDAEIDHAYVEVSRRKLVVALTRGKHDYISFPWRSDDYRSVAVCTVLRNPALDVVSVTESESRKQLLSGVEDMIKTAAEAPVVLEDMGYFRAEEGFELFGRQPRTETVRKSDNAYARDFTEDQIRGLVRLQELDGRAVVDLCLDEYRRLSGGIDGRIDLAHLEMWRDGVSEVRFKASLGLTGWIEEPRLPGGLPEYKPRVFIEEDGRETWEALPFLICRAEGSPPEIVILVDGTRYLIGEAWSRRYPDHLISVDYRKQGDRFLFEKLRVPGIVNS
ncbi:MAG: hypothetical protein OXH52_18800 [Gammaproteobacteria bacterium]|nr:hypothetical protein [Gammaproteobacteria bacterium]